MAITTYCSGSGSGSDGTSFAWLIDYDTVNQDIGLTATLAGGSTTLTLGSRSNNKTYYSGPADQWCTGSRVIVAGPGAVTPYVKAITAAEVGSVPVSHVLATLIMSWTWGPA